MNRIFWLFIVIIGGSHLYAITIRHIQMRDDILVFQNLIVFVSDDLVIICSLLYRVELFCHWA